MTPKHKPLARRFRFSIRFLFIILLIVAAYSAGWVSHRAWSRRQIQEIIVDVATQVDPPVNVEQLEDVNVVVLRGSPDAVRQVQEIANDIERLEGGGSDSPP